MRLIRKCALLLVLALLTCGLAAAEETVSISPATLSNTAPGTGEEIKATINATNALAYNFWLFDATGTIVQEKTNTTDTEWKFKVSVPGIYLLRTYATNFVTEGHADTEWFAVTDSTPAVSVQPATLSGERKTGAALTATMNATNALAYNYWLFDGTGTIVQEKTNTMDTTWDFSIAAPGTYLLRAYATNFVTDGWADTEWFDVQTANPVQVGAVTLSTTNFTVGDTLHVDAPVSGGTGLYAYNYWVFNDQGAIVMEKTNTLESSADFPLNNEGVYLLRVYATDFVTDSHNDSAWFSVSASDEMPEPTPEPEEDPIEYTYEIVDGKAIITGLKRNLSDEIRYTTGVRLRIPASIDGYPVTEIADDAFNRTSYFFYVSEISIPDTVERIGFQAFFSLILKNPMTISIPASVKEIGMYAFSYLYKVTAFNVDANNPSYRSVAGVLFSKDLTTLYNYPLGKAGSTYIVPAQTTMLYCTCFASSDLENLIVQNPRVRRMGYTFYGCDLKLYGKNSISLEQLTDRTEYGKVEYIEEEQSYSSVLGDLDNNGIVDANDIALLEAYLNGDPTLYGLALIPADVNRDGFVNQADLNAMRNGPIEQPTDEPIVDTIEYAYRVVGGKAVITGLKTELTMEDRYYTGVSLNIPASIDGYTVTEIADDAFDGNSDYFLIREITIPDTVERIGYNAFFNHSVTESSVINIPASVEEIADYAFSYLWGVTAFEVDANNPSYRSIAGVLYTRDLTTLQNYPLAKAADTYIVPKETTLLFCTSFAGADNLKNLIVQNSRVRRMGYTFAYCDLKLYGDNSISQSGLDSPSPFGKVEFITEKQSYSSIPGDLDNNGVVDANDVALLEAYLSGDPTLYGLALIPADVNQDGFVNQADLSAIKAMQ